MEEEGKFSKDVETMCNTLQTVANVDAGAVNTGEAMVSVTRADVLWSTQPGSPLPCRTTLAEAVCSAVQWLVTTVTTAWVGAEGFGSVLKGEEPKADVADIKKAIECVEKLHTLRFEPDPTGTVVSARRSLEFLRFCVAWAEASGAVAKLLDEASDSSMEVSVDETIRLIDLCKLVDFELFTSGAEKKSEAVRQVQNVVLPAVLRYNGALQEKPLKAFANKLNCYTAALEDPTGEKVLEPYAQEAEDLHRMATTIGQKTLCSASEVLQRWMGTVGALVRAKRLHDTSTLSPDAQQANFDLHSALQSLERVQVASAADIASWSVSSELSLLSKLVMRHMDVQAWVSSIRKEAGTLLEDSMSVAHAMLTAMHSEIKDVIPPSDVMLNPKVLVDTALQAQINSTPSNMSARCAALSELRTRLHSYMQKLRGVSGHSLKELLAESKTTVGLAKTAIGVKHVLGLVIKDWKELEASERALAARGVIDKLALKGVKVFIY